MNASARTFEFQPAVRERVSLLIALAGASGSGKTFSALRLAKGMTANGGKIAFLDTEARRGLHYAEQFQFMHADMRPPFRPDAFAQGIRAAEQAGANVIITDSFSHEYDGAGGILDWADELAASGVKSPGNWKEPKLAHKKLMNALLQCRASIIFCLRADEKISIEREGGKTVVRPLGWMPICEKRFMFEMTASFTLTPDRPGIPHFDLPHKLQSQHRGMFTDKSPISEDSGRALAQWAAGTTAPPSAAATPPPDRAAAADEPAASLKDETTAGEAAGEEELLANFEEMIAMFRSGLTKAAKRGEQEFRSAWEAVPAVYRRDLAAFKDGLKEKMSVQP